MTKSATRVPARPNRRRKSSRQTLSVLTRRNSGVKGDGGAPTRILNYLPKRVYVRTSAEYSLEECPVPTAVHRRRITLAVLGGQEGRELRPL